MSWAVEEEGPCLGHYQVGADALYAEYFCLAIFVVVFTPVVFGTAGGYAAVAFVTGCFASALPG